MKNEAIVLAAPIGVCIVVKGVVRTHSVEIRLYSESGVDEGAYYPAQDINIYGENQVTSLRDFCDSIINKMKELQNENSTTKSAS